MLDTYESSFVQGFRDTFKSALLLRLHISVEIEISHEIHDRRARLDNFNDRDERDARSVMIIH